MRDGAGAAPWAATARALLDRIDAATAVQARLDARIEVLIEPYRRRVALLATIPGVNPTTAPVILAEIGTDITLFPSAGHLASWAGICPGHHESADKHNAGTTRPGDPWLVGVLRRAAISAARGKNPTAAAMPSRRSGTWRSPTPTRSSSTCATRSSAATKKPTSAPRHHHGRVADHRRHRDHLQGQRRGQARGAARLLGEGPRRRHGAPRRWKRIRSPAATPYRLDQVDECRVIERR
jgi:hypothetical protein